MRLSFVKPASPKPLKMLFEAACFFWKDQRGLAGLETAIVLIAFIVVSAEFAFAALYSGNFSSDKAKEAIQAGMAQTRSTLELKGSVVLSSSTTGASGIVSSIAFQVGSAAGGEAIDLTPGMTVVRYTDGSQSKLFSSASGFTVTPLGPGDSDQLLERNEVYHLQLINLNTLGAGNDKLTVALGPNTAFIVEVIPSRGAVLWIDRTTRTYLDTATSLH